MSSSDKKDLTRIEDLGEYIHQLEEKTQNEGLPELPLEEESSFGDSFGNDEVSSFETSEEGSTTEEPLFEIPAEESIDFDSSDFGSSDFNSNEETAFEMTEDPFAEAPSETETLEFAIDSESFESESESESTATSEPLPELDVFPESEPEPATSIFANKTQLEAPVLETPYKAPENFSDVRQFSESSSFTGIGAEGNPSFSVLIKNVRYLEDVNDIMILMKELGLAVDTEEQMRARLMRGNLLVPRISEFAAVLLAHKLRRFDIDIQVGLSDEIHPPKHGEAPETGIVSKYSLYQNQTHHFHFDDPKLEISQIIVAATPALEGYQVVRYLGVASEHKMLEGHLVEDETSSEIPRYYHELAQKLKAHALKAHSNAVVGLNYQLTPLPSEYGMAGAKYRLTCTGNLVWVNKL